jgi:hypothetical protein
VYNGGCSNVLTCLAKVSQSPMYMSSWLLERFWRPVHVMSWPSEERLSPVEVQLSGLSDRPRSRLSPSPGDQARRRPSSEVEVESEPRGSGEAETIVRGRG